MYNHTLRLIISYSNMEQKELLNLQPLILKAIAYRYLGVALPLLGLGLPEQALGWLPP